MEVACWEALFEAFRAPYFSPMNHFPLLGRWGVRMGYFRNVPTGAKRGQVREAREVRRFMLW